MSWVQLANGRQRTKEHPSEQTVKKCRQKTAMATTTGSGPKGEKQATSAAAAAGAGGGEGECGGAAAVLNIFAGVAWSGWLHEKTLKLKTWRGLRHKQLGQPGQLGTDTETLLLLPLGINGWRWLLWLVVWPRPRV
ncbi:hypothetical protein ACLKA6_014101 [Drosophila palustris]